MSTPLSDALHAFARTYAMSPTIGARAPGRVNLIGDHTDYAQGLVLPLAIDRSTILLAAPSSEPRSRLLSLALDQRASLDLPALLAAALHDPTAALAALAAVEPRWARYLASTAVQLHRHAIDHDLKLRAPPTNLDLLIAGDLPLGAGLSSSAALESATCLILEAAWDLELPPRHRAAIAHRAEHLVGVPCGVMDQLVVNLARPGHAALIDCREHSLTPIPIPPAADLLVIDSGVRHELAASGYARLHALAADAARQLAPRAIVDLRDPPDAEDLRALGPAADVLTHIITENQRVRDASIHLARADLPALGRAMNESHASMRDRLGVSIPQIEAIIEHADRIPGVHGVRLTGGGFGGSAIVLVDRAAPDPLPILARALQPLRTAHAIRVQPSACATLLAPEALMPQSLG